MTKKHTLKKHSADDISKLLADTQEELRALRFSIAGSKNRNVKLVRTLRKTIARGLTELHIRPKA